MDSDSPTEIVFHTDIAENVVRMHSNRHMQPSTLRTMYDRDILFDVTLYGARPADTPAAYLRPIRAHKSVLASVSRHLYDLFTCHGYRDSHKCEYRLVAVNHESLEHIVQLIYTDEIKTTMENAVSVMCGILVGADYLVMENLADACENFLVGNQQAMKPENCVEIWCIARKLRRSALMHATSNAIASNLADMPKDAEFLRMDYDDISTLLKSDELKNVDPDRKCAAAIAWLEFDSAVEATRVAREAFAGSIADMIPLKFGAVSYDTACKAHACEMLQKHAPGTVQKLTAAWQKKKEFTQSVASSSAYDEKGIWYVMGGNETPQLFCKYDVARGYWSTMPDMPWERYYFGACAVAGRHHRLVAIGGFKDGKLSLDIDEYDLLAETWSLSSAKLNSKRLYPSAISDDADRVYAFGGRRSHDIDVYDLISKTVTKREIADERSHAGAAQYIKVVDADTNEVKCIYSAGSIYNDNNGDGYIHKLHLLNNNDSYKWSIVGAMLSGARLGVGLAIAGDDLYLLGGSLPQPHTADDIPVNSVEIFNTRTGQIRTAPDLLHASMFFQATTAYDGNVVCALGGKDTKDRELSSVETYDVREGRWSTGTIIPDMPTPAYCFGFAAV